MGTFRWAGLLCVPVGGGPPASRPRRELRSARRLEARPGPDTAHGHRSLAPTGTPALTPGPHARPSRPALTPLIPVPTPNFACNSPMTASSFEFRSLELQRFQTLLKLLPIELHATFVEDRPWRTAWGIGLVDTLHGHDHRFQRASTKEISPQQGTPALGSRLQ